MNRWPGSRRCMRSTTSPGLHRDGPCTEYGPSFHVQDTRRVEPRFRNRRMSTKQKLKRGPSTGKPTNAHIAPQAVADRFWAKVDVRGPDDCWLWTAYKSKYGYGSFKPANDVSPVMAHRWAYECVTRQPIPQGLTLDHLCRVRHCCNPRHLEPVTVSVNVERSSLMESVHRRQKVRTHCPHGHPYSPENTRVRTIKGRPARVCRTCHG